MARLAPPFSAASTRSGVSSSSPPTLLSSRPCGCWLKRFCRSSAPRASPLCASTLRSPDLCPELPDYALFRALPGAGPALAPRLCVAFGERCERFPNAAALQKYAGVAPVTERSGDKSWVHWRYSCPTFLRQTFVEWVGQTIPRSFWAKAFYDACRARGARHQAALRALAFKWIRVLHRCWVDRVAYDESRYLMALQKRRAPLLNSLLKAHPEPHFFFLAVRLRA
jgi:hypothetical protein